MDKSFLLTVLVLYKIGLDGIGKSIRQRIKDILSVAVWTIWWIDVKQLFWDQNEEKSKMKKKAKLTTSECNVMQSVSGQVQMGAM